MDTPVSPVSVKPSRPTFSCIRCADRKVKCDRQRPCSACAKHGVECLYNPSRPHPKRHKRVKDLTNQLRHYEALLQEQGIDPSKRPDAAESGERRASTYTAFTEPQIQTPSSMNSEPCESITKAHVVRGQGRTQLVDNGLWSRVVEEYHDPEDALEDSSYDASDREASDEDIDFVLSSRPKSKIKSHHPPPERIQQLWQLFVENVDPLTKVVHVPTLRQAIQKAMSNTKTVPRSFEALMFAIYSAAVMSSNDEDCMQQFSESRKTLLSRYISATKAALSRANFMGTISLVVLQALILHIISARDIYEPRVVWSLTGVAVRIAESMGLERDGLTLGLPPFETEMRRRLWWLLKSHDFRTAELVGLAKFRGLDTGHESTKWPTNVNDDRLYPEMPSLPEESDGLADTLFVCFRYDLSNFAAARIAKYRQQGMAPNQWDLHATKNRIEVDDAMAELQELVETKYLRYCDPTQPLQLLTMVVGRFSLNLIRFLSRHPRRWSSIEQTPLSERQWVWEISIKILEGHNMALSSPQLKQFTWHAAYFLPWHTFIHVLDTLRANPLIADAEKVWQIISSIYENIPEMVLYAKKPIHVAVGNLCLKAYSARETALKQGNMPLPPTPEFISQLRQQREDAKAKLQARQAKHSGKPARNGESSDLNVGPTPDASVTHASETLESTHLQSNSTSYAHLAADVDPFWLMNGDDDGQFDNSGDVMDMDLDFMLAQDDSAWDQATQNISWEQWDAWLADSNIIRPLPSARS